jgi:HSP20 family protein
MAAIRINRLGTFNQLRNEMDRLVSDFVQALPATNWQNWNAAGGYPAMNVWDAGTELHAEAELPGVQEADLEIFVIGNELTVRGERKASDVAGTAYHRRERSSGKFSRVLHLPSDVNADGVQATLRDGVLHLTMPKAEAAKPRKVQVNG